MAGEAGVACHPRDIAMLHSFQHPRMALRMVKGVCLASDVAARPMGNDQVKATIWHNPRCSKSRETLAILRAAPGVEIEVVDYLEEAPTRATLAALYGRAGMTPHDGLRKSEQLAEDLARAYAGGDAILDAMAANPILIERPLVETDKGVRLARPPEKVREIL